MMDFKNKEIEDLLEPLNKIGKVSTSAVFKERVLVKIAEEKTKTFVVNWFTPKLQIAAMIVILLVNTIAISYLFKSKEDVSLENFVEQYELNSSSVL